MANTLATIIPKILARGLLALREQAIMPRLVNGDYSGVATQKGAVINVPLSMPQTATDVTPANTPPVPADTTPPVVAITLANWKKTNFNMSDKDLQEVDANAAFLPLQTSEALRALANAINLTVLQEYKGIFGYTGTAGTTPFATDTSAAVNARKILHQQRAPREARRLVLNFDAEANALSLAAFANFEQTGDQGPKIEGNLGRKFGFDWFTDDQVLTHTPNAIGAGALTVNGVQAINVGSTDGGRTGTLSIAKGAGANWNALKGDIIAIAGFTQTYAVDADIAVVQAANTTVTVHPALQQATAGGEAVSFKAAHVVNLGFHRDAFAMAIRPISLSDVDSQLSSLIRFATDPQTGITLRLEVTRQYKQTMWEWDVLWGAKLVRPEGGVRIAG